MNQHSNNGHRLSSRNTLWGILLVILGGLFLLDQFLPGQFGAMIALVVFGGIGATFYSVYLADRRNWWALIPTYAVWATAGIVFLAALLHVSGEWVVAYVMFAIAFPFFYVFMRNRQHWWALIPGGIMGTIGLGFLIAGLVSSLAPLIPVLMIIGGLYLLVRNMGTRKQQTAVHPEQRDQTPQFEPIRVPQTGPEADRPR
jgi:hypothetical protein